MLDMSNQLLDLERALEDADESLARACNVADDLKGYYPDHGDPAWPLVDNVMDTVYSLQQILRVLRQRPELVEAFRQAHADIDHQADLADGANY